MGSRTISCVLDCCGARVDAGLPYFKGIVTCVWQKGHVTAEPSCPSSDAPQDGQATDAVWSRNFSLYFLFGASTTSS